MADQSDLNKKRDELEKLIGKSPSVKIDSFQNWSTSRKIDNLLVVRPKSLEEIQNVVKAARKLKLQVRCAGAQHSWGPLFPDEGNILMYIQDIKRHDGPNIELIKNSDDDIRVNVTAGITVRELKEFELENKVSLRANVVLTEPTYGGVVSLGCHGVGWNFQSMSDFCLQMRIVDSNGELKTFTKADDRDMMLAVQCNIGMFGIIYDMQLDLIEEKICHAHNDFSYTAGDLFYNAKNLKEMVEKNDSVEIFYWPFSSVGWIDAAEQLTTLLGSNQTLTRDEWDPKEDGCWVRKINIPDQSTVSDDLLQSDLYYKYLNMRSWLEMRNLNVADDFIITIPSAVTPLACKAAYNWAKESMSGDIYQRLPNAIHFRDNIGLGSVADAEWAFDAKKDFSNVTKAVQIVLELARSEAENGKFPLNMVIEMRWMAFSESCLCPAVVGDPAKGGSGHTVYIEILSYTGTPGWHEFSSKVVKEWQKIPGARPHWAKEWDNIDGIDGYLKKVWSKEIKQFTSALARSQCDPDGIFLNRQLADIFFPGKKLAVNDDNNVNSGDENANSKDMGDRKDGEKSKKDEKKSSTCHLL